MASDRPSTLDPADPVSRQTGLPGQAGEVEKTGAPTLSPESLDLRPGEFLQERETGVSGYAAKLKSPRRKVVPAKKRRWGLYATRRRRNLRLPILFGTLVVFALVLALTAATRTHVKPLPILTLQDFSSSQAVRGVTARPPSLYIEVDQKSWNRFTVSERQALVDRIGAKAQAAGYAGVLLRNASGVSIAQWLSASGTRLFKKPDSPS